jgi:hypothetical protein
LDSPTEVGKLKPEKQMCEIGSVKIGSVKIETVKIGTLLL